MNVNWYMPTRVLMADECILENAQLMSKLGTKACIVTGTKSARINGALQDVTQALEKCGVPYAIYDRVMANPTVSCVYEGAAFARENRADFVIGIGGGSPMDAAKAIALLTVNEISEEELFHGIHSNSALPSVMIPTTAGTGSEVTANSILTSDRLLTKKSISAPILYPRLALLDAKYLKHLPMSVTIHTALDALSHAIEGMLSVRASQMTDLIAADSIRKISHSLKYLSPEAEPNLSEGIRKELLYASMLAGVVIAHTGTTAVHSMGYSLTYFKNIDHGRANALLLPSFLRFTAKNNPEDVARILLPLGLNSVDEFEALFLRLTGEHEHITEQEAEKFTSIATTARNIKNSRVIPSRDDVYQIYIRSLQITEFQ